MTASSGDARQVDVCVCTFRRASVHDTLRSLSEQVLPPGVALRVIVADNDDTPAARAAIEESARRFSLRLEYCHAPARNISIARNAALALAAAPLVAMLDDDEVASRCWIAHLLKTHDATQADVVLGPAEAVYPADAPDWMRQGDFHATRPEFVGGEIVAGYTSNVLIAREAPPLVGLTFRPELGRTGGEDTEFFHRAHARGASFAYAADAVVREKVDPGRLSLRWLARRRFRFGQTHAALLTSRARGPGDRARDAALAGAKCLVCVGGVAVSVASPRHRAFWFLRAALHAGVVSRLLGMGTLVQYGGGPAVAPR